MKIPDFLAIYGYIAVRMTVYSAGILAGGHGTVALYNLQRMLPISTSLTTEAGHEVTATRLGCQYMYATGPLLSQYAENHRVFECEFGYERAGE